MSLKVAIIGLGNISGAHIEQWKQIETAQIVAGSDVSEAAVAKATEAHGFTGYTDWRKMLDEVKPDAVSICTPPFLHREMAIEAMERGINVLCEKPMAATLEDAIAMHEAAQKASSVVMIAYCHRFHGPMIRLRELLAEGIIGQPVFFRGAFTGIIDFKGNHRANKAQSGGGALMDNGSHAADLYQFLLGKVANVSCRAGTYMSEIETDDVAVILFEGENGAYGEVIVGYALPGEFTDWRVTGTRGMIEVRNYFSGPIFFREHGQEEWQEFACDNSQTRFQRQFAHFVDCVEKGVPCQAGTESALHTMKIITRAYEEAERKGLKVE